MVITLLLSLSFVSLGQILWLIFDPLQSMQISMSKIHCQWQHNTRVFSMMYFIREQVQGQNQYFTFMFGNHVLYDEPILLRFCKQVQWNIYVFPSLNSSESRSKIKSILLLFFKILNRIFNKPVFLKFFSHVHCRWQHIFQYF